MELENKVCDKIDGCPFKEHLLPHQKEEYCYSEKYLDCPYEHSSFFPKRNLLQHILPLHSAV